MPPPHVNQFRTDSVNLSHSICVSVVERDREYSAGITTGTVLDARLTRRNNKGTTPTPFVTITTSASDKMSLVSGRQDAAFHGPSTAHASSGRTEAKWRQRIARKWSLDWSLFVQVA
jgi:hypothetical protein